MIATVFEKLIGLTSAKRAGGGDSVPPSERKIKSIVGKALAYLLVVETNGKLALHAHATIWSILLGIIFAEPSSR